MNKYLKSAVERFEKLGKKPYLISPMSIIDAEIFVELSEILRKNNLGGVKAILDLYKYKKDEDIRDDLMQYNIDNPELLARKTASALDSAVADMIEDDGKQAPNPYLMHQFEDISNFRLKIMNIVGYEKREVYNAELRRTLPCIIINECDVNATKKPMYANKKLFYFNLDDMEADYDVLDEIL